MIKVDTIMLSGTNFDNWESTYSVVSSNSADWELGGSGADTEVRALTANWQSTYSTVNTNSANWNYQGVDIKSLTGNWQSDYNTTLNNSAGWESTGSTVNTNSAGWESTESTVNTNSANWNYQGTDIKSLTANWESTYSSVNTNSAGWESTESTLNSNSAGWESTESTLNSNSANWNSVYTSFNLNSSEYESVYLTVSSNSADWELGGSGLTLFVEVSSNTGENSSIPVYALTANSLSSDVDAAIVPKNQGSLLASVPDGTIIGGNKRGIYSIDLQLSRLSASQVAGSPYSVIVGGLNNEINTLSSTTSFIGGGSANFIKTSPYTFIGGGAYNQILSSSYTFIGGGRYNSISGTSLTTSKGSIIIGGDTNTIIGNKFNLILGGDNNQILYNDGEAGVFGIDYSFIGGGNFNEINNKNSIILGGGYNHIHTIESTGGNNFISTLGNNFIGLGNSNRVYNGIHSIVLGGSNNWIYGFPDTALTASSILGGYNNYIYGEISQLSGSYSSILGGRNNSLYTNDSFIVGSNITANAISGFTYVNNISAVDTKSDSRQWHSTYTTVSTHSALWESVETTIQNNSSNWVLNNGQLGITVDGTASFITTGVKGYLRVPYDCVIESWTLYGNAVGYFIMDVYKSNYAGYPPTSSIAGSELPTLENQIINQDTDLSTWTTTALSAGEFLGFSVLSASGASRVTLSLNILKTP